MYKVNILTKIIETEKAKLLVIGGLPDDTKGVCIYDGDLNWQSEKGSRIEEIPNGNWQLLGKLPEITEEQWDEIVEGWNTPTGGDDYQETYQNYYIKSDEDYRDNYHFYTATESGLSLIEANCKLRNESSHPSEIEPTIRNHFDKLAKEWNNEQSQVFTNPIIFVSKRQ